MDGNVDLVLAELPAELFFHEPGRARDRILELEARLRAVISDGEAVENTHTMPLRHQFIPGAYAREMTIPAGTLLVGKIHRFPCFNVVTAGDITVLTENGVKRVTAPAFFRSEAGLKRVGYAHADTVWTCIHPTAETDLDKLEAELTCERYEDLGQIEGTAVVPLIDVA